MNAHISSPPIALASLAAALFLAACSTADQASSNAVENTLSVPGAVAAVDPATLAPPATQTAFVGNAARVHFTPIVGAPVEKVSALSRRLSAAGQGANVRLLPANTQGIDHEIRGYFSALSENGGTTVIHVWDVFTPDGRRVHRIQGQERVNGAAGNPWTAVPNAVMEQIADRVLSEYATWRGNTA